MCLFQEMGEGKTACLEWGADRMGRFMASAKVLGEETIAQGQGKEAEGQ